MYSSTAAQNKARNKNNKVKQEETSYYNRAINNYNNWSFQEAITLCDEELKQSNNLDSLILKGKSLNQLYEHEKALECFNAVLTKGGNNKKAILGKAHTLHKLYEYEQALKLFDGLIDSINQDQNTDNANCTYLTSALIARGTVLSDLERNEEALECFKKLGNKAYCSMGNVYGKQNNLEKAFEYYDKAIKENTNNTSAYIGKGYLFIRESHSMNDNRDQQGVDTNVDNNQNNLSEKKKEKIDSAIELFDEAIKINARSAEAYNAKGFALSLKAKAEITRENNEEKRKYNEEAKECFKKALEFKPEYSEALHNKAEILREEEAEKFKTNLGLEYHILSDDWYREEDISPIAKKILDSKRHNSAEQFSVVGSEDQLRKFISSYYDSENGIEQKPIFVIYNKNGNHWVTFCITEDKGQKLVLYKDSLGEEIPFDIEQVIKNKFNNIKFKSHRNKEQLDNYSCGPMSLNNLKIIIDGLSSDNKDNFIRQFINTKFTKQEDVSDSKIAFCNIEEVSNKIKEYAEKLSNNSEFCSELQTYLKTFIGKYKGCITYASQMQKIISTELSGEEDDTNYAILSSLTKKLSKDLSTDKINTADFKRNQKNLNKVNDKFAEEFLQFKKIFDLLNHIKNSTDFNTNLKYISDTLKLNYESIKSFTEVEKTQQKSPEHLNIFLKPRNINSIVEEETKVTSTEGIKSFDKLLEELLLGDDNAENKCSEETLRDKKNGLKDLYDKVKCYYVEKANWGKDDINSWAKKHKGTLTSDDEVTCETLAILDRANQIVEGHNLRDSQILASLVFLQTKEEHGRLCEIKTGEGKTTIVSLLATIKALQGETIDIITSNNVLAKEGFKARDNFYSLFGLTVATNNPDEKKPYITGPKSCYTADVLYGSIGNFQFDYLRDSFEGNGTRAGREFGTVLIDEVDSMLIDNGGHIAKLSGPLPGMESLKYIYIRIWIELKKTFDSKKASIQEAWDKKLEGLAEDLDPDKIDNEFESFRADYLNNSLEDIKQMVKESIGNLEVQKKLVPAHLREYSENKIDQWIDNAIHAKFVYHEDQHYIIKKQDGEDCIIPVDYENTGVTLNNTIWSNGLHQFVQLKHNLQLTAESLTSCFISNVGYIKKYGNKIFGLTGTLGSSAEHNLLSTMYNLDYAKISTFKEKKLKELTGQVIQDSDWDFEVANDSIEQCKKGRAVLIICETIADLRAIKENLALLKKLTTLKGIFEYYTYENQDDSKVTNLKLNPGSIIIATNIAGRGTDFKTSEEVEKNGGLHVNVGFLPCNQRVEHQAFGRTARQGNNGTCKLMIKKSEGLKLGFSASTFDEVGDEKKDINLIKEIKEARDKSESERLEQIKQKELPALKFQDELFAKFSEEYRKFNDKSSDNIDYMFASRDIKEYWAYWLEMNKDKFDKFEFNGSNTQHKAVEVFNDFLKENKVKELQKGKIQHNPYYSIQKAEYLIKQEKFSTAKNELDNAIELSEGSTELMCSIYIKLFNIEIEGGKQLTERFKKALAKLIFINISKNEDYKKAALENLRKAKEALKIRLDYLNTEILNYKKLFPKESNTNNNAQEEEQFDFKEILIATEGENLLLKHLAADQTGLNLYLQNVESLLEELEKCDGASISSKINDHFYDYKQKTDAREKEIVKKVKETKQNEEENEQSIRESITNSDIEQIRAIGLDPIFAIKDIRDVENKVIYAAQGQIAGGLAALAAGFAFPPCMVVMGPIAGALMGEGISDIIFELLNQGEEHDEKAYNQGKAISYGISVATMGIGAAAAGLKILAKASKACKGVVKALKNSPKFKAICKKVADQVEKLGKLFENMHVEHMKKWDNAKDLYSLQKLQKAGKLDAIGVKQLKELKSWNSSLVKNVGKSVVQDAVSTVLMEGLFNPNLQLLMSELVKKLEGKIGEKVRKEINSDLLNSFITKQLTTENYQEISLKNLIQETLEDQSDSERTINISKEIVCGAIRGTDAKGKIRGSIKIAKTLKVISGIADTILTAVDLEKYPGEFCSKFNAKLQENQANKESESGTIFIKNRKDELQKVIKNLLKDQFKDFLLEYILYEDTFNSLKEKLLNLFEHHFQEDIKKLIDENFQNEQIKNLSDKQFKKLIEALSKYFSSASPQKSYFDFCITTDELGHLSFIGDWLTFKGTIEESFNECNKQLEKYYGICFKERTANEIDIQHNVISAKEYIKETILGQFTAKITGFISKYSNTYLVNPMIHRVLSFKFKKAESNEIQHLVPKELSNTQDLSSEHADHFRELGVGSNASLQEINKAYRKLSLEHHPDKVKGSDEHSEQLRKERTEKQTKLNLALEALIEFREKTSNNAKHSNEDSNIHTPSTEPNGAFNTASNVADYSKSIKRGDALRSSQLQQFSGTKRQVDDTASRGNCRQISMSQLFNDKEGVHKHTVSSIVRDYTMTPTPGNLKQLDKILQTRYQDTALIRDTLSPLKIKSWMQNNKFNSCLIAIEFPNPITVNGQNVGGHVTFARLEDGQVIISDKQRDANGKVLPDMSMSDYFKSTGIDPKDIKDIHVRQLIDGDSTRPIIVTESGKLSGDGVDDIKSNHDQMRLSLDDSNCMDVEQQNHSSRRDSTDMDVDFGAKKRRSDIKLKERESSEGVKNGLGKLSNKQENFVKNTLLDALKEKKDSLSLHNKKNDFLSDITAPEKLHIDVEQLPGAPGGTFKFELQSTKKLKSSGSHDHPTFVQVIYDRKHSIEQILDGFKRSFEEKRVIDLRSKSQPNKGEETIPVRCGSQRAKSTFDDLKKYLEGQNTKENTAPKVVLTMIESEMRQAHDYQIEWLKKQKIEWLKKQNNIFRQNNKEGKNNERIKENEGLIAQLNTEITKPENPSGEGMFDYSVDSFWNKYFKVSMEKILNLRLIQNKAEDVEVLACSILDKGVFDIRDELVDHINSSDHIKILIPTNIANKHWVGLFIEKKEELTNIVYIDPENRNIPKHILHELSFILNQCNGLTNVKISQTNVEQQKYNNCGPEVIENFILLLSDTRFSQESAVIEHSHLLEQHLLHYCSENQLSGCVLDYW